MLDNGRGDIDLRDPLDPLQTRRAVELDQNWPAGSLEHVHPRHFEACELGGFHRAIAVTPRQGYRCAARSAMEIRAKLATRSGTSHRSYHASADGVDPDEILRRVVAAVPAPDGWRPPQPEVERQGFFARLFRRKAAVTS